ncbi:hypothetical protein K2Q08_01820, partial [Patescibacteria group bacterium]|nr:hypothetical protein [Patescibacteria group bacterium]
TTSITIEGTAEAGTSITLTATLAGGATTSAATTTSSGGLWSIPLSVLEGTTTISVVAANSDGVTSSAVSRSFISDITAPSVVVFSLLECNHSLITGGTCAGGLQATPSLSSPSSDVASYTYIVDGLVNSTSTTLGPITLSAGSHSVSIAAYDAAGNGATSTPVTIVALSMPVIINEVGWMGTQASGADQWVELFNQNSGYVINMANVRLSTDDWATASMTGVLSNTDMYLVERSQIVSDIAADHIDSNLAFTSQPAQLRLEYTAGGYATTTIDATPIATACGSIWCAGTDDTLRRSMERTRPDLSGTTATNWNSNNTFAIYGRDSNSVKINGSLKEPNSLGQHNVVQYTCEPPFTSFYVEGGSYVPGGTSCRYYSPTIFGSIHYATAFAGTVGSSTQYGGHMTGSLTDTIEAGDVIPSGYDVQGQDLFVAVFTIPPGALATPYLNQFLNYFTTGAEAPPMGNYGIFRFKYGN